VRGYQQIGAPPQGVVRRERLRVGDVERRPHTARVEQVDQGVIVDERAAAHIDQQRAAFHGRQAPGVHDRTRWIRRDRQDHDVESGEHRVEPVRALAAPAAAREARDVRLERLESPGDRLPDPAPPDDRNRGVGQGGAADVAPRSFGHVPRGHVDVALHGDRQSDGQLGGAGVVDPDGPQDQHPVG
jgi:hypothetical protein